MAVNKNSPASAGDVGLSPGPGGFHMLQSDEARGPQPLSLCVTTAEVLSPTACALQQGKPPKPEAQAPQR